VPARTPAAASAAAVSSSACPADRASSYYRSSRSSERAEREAERARREASRDKREAMRAQAEADAKVKAAAVAASGAMAPGKAKGDLYSSDEEQQPVSAAGTTGLTVLGGKTTPEESVAAMPAPHLKAAARLTAATSPAADAGAAMLRAYLPSTMLRAGNPVAATPDPMAADAPTPPTAEADGDRGSSASADEGARPEGSWDCEHCTLINEAWRQKCSLCQRKSKSRRPSPHESATALPRILTELCDRHGNGPSFASSITYSSSYLTRSTGGS